MRVCSINSVISNIKNFCNNPTKVKTAYKNFNLILLGSILGSVSMMVSKASDTNKHANDIKKEVLATGISKAKFDSIDSSISAWNTRNKAVAWQEVLDSVKFHGQAQKAYFDASQNMKNSK